MSKWIAILMSAAMLVAPPMALAASTKKSETPIVVVSPTMVPRLHVYAQPVNPVIEPAAQPVMTKNFAAPQFSCRPSMPNFDGGRCGY